MTDWKHANFEWGIQFALEAVKGAFLANAGAAVALLAFAASVVAGDGFDPETLHVYDLRWAMNAFIFGIVLSTLAFTAGWISQRLYAADHEGQQLGGNVGSSIGLALAVGALVAFPLGCHWASGAILLDQLPRSEWAPLVRSCLGAFIS